MNVLLGVTGSIAARLNNKLEQSLLDSCHKVQTVVTQSAKYFKTTSYHCVTHNDECEWHDYKYKETVLHIDLVKWADLFLIAPCTANTIAKLKHQFADNLLTNCALAWNFEKPFIVAPAMNTQMWENIGKDKCLINTPIKLIEPQEKTLYCGDTGSGAMAEISRIVDIVNGFDSSRRFRPEIV